MAASRYPQAPWLWLSAAMVALDQWSKHLVESAMAPYEVRAVLPVLDLVRARNTGVAFSFFDTGGSWQRWFFSALALAVGGVLVAWLVKLPRSARLQAAGLSLVLAGAVGNLIDRLRLGSVVDFILVHWHQHYFWAFNVADSAITVGAGCLVLDTLLSRGAAPRGG